jgi:hypothetical protein
MQQCQSTIARIQTQHMDLCFHQRDSRVKVALIIINQWRSLQSTINGLRVFSKKIHSFYATFSSVNRPRTIGLECARFVGNVLATLT